MRLRTPAILATTAALALGAAACGEEEDPAASQGSGTQEQQQTTPEPVAEVPSVTGEDTAVALDAGFVTALEDLGLTPGTVGDATLEEGSLAFPITAGNVTYYEPGSVSPFVQGMLEHEGSGFSLTAGDTTVELTDFVVDPGTSELTGTVSANGEVAAESAPLFFLDGSTLEPLQAEGDTAVLTGTTVKLKAEAAALLNETFGTDALEEGLEIGTATITLNTAA